MFVSADLIAHSRFLGYAQMMQEKGLVRRVFVDKSYLIFTSSDWRPKLVQVREMRRVKCPIILLTATLPKAYEAELESAMAVQVARYIRAPTTRIRIRYVVQEVTSSKLIIEAVDLCRRMVQHLGRKKGVVYSKSRRQCEELAREIQCLHFHAAALDNTEQLERWL